MNRRQILLGTLGLVLPAGAARADTRDVKFNFNLGRSALYGGKRTIAYNTSERPGTIIVDTREKALFFVLEDGKAIRYSVGVGRQGFSWTGSANIRRKAEWPAWHPPEAMRIRELKKYGRELPVRMEGGPNNPLGARALYLYQGNQDTLYRIHGTNNPRSIGRAMSSGCIRLLNEEVIDLYARVKIGAKAIIV